MLNIYDMKAIHIYVTISERDIASLKLKLYTKRKSNPESLNTNVKQ